MMTHQHNVATDGTNCENQVHGHLRQERALHGGAHRCLQHAFGPHVKFHAQFVCVLRPNLCCVCRDTVSRLHHKMIHTGQAGPEVVVREAGKLNGFKDRRGRAERAEPLLQLAFQRVPQLLRLRSRVRHKQQLAKGI